METSDMNGDLTAAKTVVQCYEVPVEACPCLDTQIHPKFHYVKRRFLITSKYRYMYRVLNVDEIKN
jgi:hypothetical protein